MYQWHYEFGSYYLKDGDRIISMVKSGAGIGVCYTKGKSWTIHKHGDPVWVKEYCDTCNQKLQNANVDIPELQHHYVEIRRSNIR